jgi:cadmium resistance protein CadD (predicted permease)
MTGHFFLAVTTFIITNIDDLLILTFYLGAARYPVRSVVAGQYLGIIALILVSLSPLLVKDLIPSRYIGVLGLFPIALGIKELLEKNEKAEETPVPSKITKSNGMWAVALVTIANGGDNIGVYTPLFMGLDLQLLPFYIGIFLALTAAFCFLGYYFVNHPVTKEAVTRYGNSIMPWFLIMLGLWILADLF